MYPENTDLCSHVSYSHVTRLGLHEKWRQCFCLLVCIIGTTQGQTTDELSGSADPDLKISDIPVALVTIGVLIVCFIIGFLIAKAVEHCYDRRTIRDDASDISEFTKELLKAQFIYAFNKKLIGKVKSNETVRQRARRLGRIWVAKARRSIKDRKVTDGTPTGEGSEQKDGITLVSVKVIGDKDTKTDKNEETKAKERNLPNVNNNQGTAGKDESPERGSDLLAMRDQLSTDPSSSVGRPQKMKTRPRKKSIGSSKSLRRKRTTKKGRRKKKRVKKVTDSKVGDADLQHKNGDTSEESDDSGSYADSDDQNKNNNSRSASPDTTTPEDGHHVTGQSPPRTAPCDDKRRLQSLFGADKEHTGSECSSRDDYEFLANTTSARKSKKAAPDEAWGSHTASSSSRIHASGNLSRVSMSVDSSLL